MEDFLHEVPLMRHKTKVLLHLSHCLHHSLVDNGTRTYEFLATEEELAAMQYELCEVKALLLHLNDKKQLLLERNGRLNDAILLKHNRHHVRQYGVSTVSPIIHANRAENNRTNGRTWSEVVSRKPNHLLLDRLSTNTNNSSHDPEHIPANCHTNYTNQYENPWNYWVQAITCP